MTFVSLSSHVPLSSPAFSLMLTIRKLFLLCLSFSSTIYSFISVFCYTNFCFSLLFLMSVSSFSFLFIHVFLNLFSAFILKLLQFFQFYFQLVIFLLYSGKFRFQVFNCGCKYFDHGILMNMKQFH